MKRLARWLGLAGMVWLAATFALIWRGPDEPPEARATYAVVLGAAVMGDEPTPVFAARIDHAVDLWRQGRVRRIVFTGGTGEGDRLSEAAAARRYALAAGVPAAAILSETRSQTTRQNLAFARPLLAGGTALVVSDKLHLKRAMAMAEALGLRATPSPVRHSAYRTWRTKLPFALRELYFLHHFWLFGE